MTRNPRTSRPRACHPRPTLIRNICRLSDSSRCRTVCLGDNLRASDCLGCANRKILPLVDEPASSPRLHLHPGGGATGIATDTCVGGKFGPVFAFLSSNGGTASLSSAPNLGPCSANWAAYGPGTTQIAADGSFAIPGVGVTSISDGAQGLNNMRAVIASGVPLAYGTRLYTDFPHYGGTPTPMSGMA